MNAHRHVPESGTEHIAPSSVPVGRGGPRGSAFIRKARCSRCGKNIAFVEARRERMEYWRVAT